MPLLPMPTNDEENAEVPPDNNEGEGNNSEENEEKSIEQQINEVYSNNEFATPFDMPTNLPDKKSSERH